MDQLIKVIAEALVDYPDKVNVREVRGNFTSVIELRVLKEDLGKVIGKEGKTAQAIRTILHAASSRFRRKAVLEIVE